MQLSLHEKLSHSILRQSSFRQNFSKLLLLALLSSALSSDFPHRKDGISDKHVQYVNPKLIALYDHANLALQTSNYDEAIQYALDLLELSKSMGNNEFVWRSYSTIGAAFYQQGKYTESLNYYSNALNTAKTTIHDDYFVILNLNDMANIYGDKSSFDKAFHMYEEALSIYEKSNKQDDLGMQKIIITILNNWSASYLQQSELDMAYTYLLRGQEMIDNFRGDSLPELALISNTWGMYYRLQGNVPLAQKYYEKSIDISKKIKNLSYIVDGYNSLNFVYKENKNYEKAYDYQNLASQYKDSCINIEGEKKIAESLVKYETREKEQELEIQKEHNKRNLIIIGFAALLASVMSFSFFKLRKKNSLINKTNKDLSSANLLITEQKERLQITNEELASTIEELDQVNQKLEETNQIITQKNEDITASINYSKTIQNAMLSAAYELSQLFPESFLLSKPKDIVGGDFHFSGYSKNNQKVLAVADCTGHGVPGAFLTIYSYDKLKELIQRYSDPSQVLDELDAIFKNLQQSQGSQNKLITDAMDIVLCYVDEEKNMLNYSGSGRPLWIVRNGEIMFYDPPMGKTLGTEGPQGFSGYITQQIPLEDGDQVYLFSDGFGDQIGGVYGKKLGQSNLKKILQQAHNYSMSEQYTRISAFLEKWTNDPVGGPQDQIDDIMLLGINYKSCSSTQKSIDSSS